MNSEVTYAVNLLTDADLLESHVMIWDSWLMAIMVTVSSFVMEVVDAAIGMGYGAILTPVLLMVVLILCRWFRLC